MSSKKGDMVSMEKGMLEGMIEALADKHSELNLNFQNVSVRLPGLQQIGVELNGTITVSVHMRDLTDEEKRAFSARNVALNAK